MSALVEEWRGKGDDASEVVADAKVFARSSDSRRLLVSLLKPRRKLVVGSMLLTVVYNATTMLGPYLVKVGIDEGIPALINDNSALPLALAVAALCITAVLQAGLDFAATFALGRLGQDVMCELRNRVFAHVMKLGVAFQERFTSGRVIARLTSDMEAVDALLNSGLRQLLWSTLTIVSAFSMLFVLDTELALVVTAFVPAVAVMTAWFRRQSFNSYTQMRERVAFVIVHFVESLRGVAAVQVFSREQRNEQIFDELNENYRQAKQRSTRLLAVYGPGVRVVGNASLALILVIGGMKVLDGEVTIGVLTAFVLYLRRAIEPVMDMSYFYDSFQAASAAMQKLSDVLAEKPRVEDADDAVVLAEARGAVRFEGVGFGYGDRQIVDDLHLEIPAGQTVALVGATGAGKTTIVKLLARFYDPDSGSITFDGVDLRRIQLASLRTHMAMVTQESFLFSKTIAENVAFGVPGATRDDVERAAKAIGAHEFIAALPDGYDTQAGKGGMELSAGQRQLISFARAFITEPRLLILDEATSSLDIPSERAVQKSLQVLLADRTAVIIAHRLSTVEIADRVIVLEHGRIVEDGPPSVLMKSKGRFQALNDAWLQSLK